MDEDVYRPLPGLVLPFQLHHSDTAAYGSMTSKKKSRGNQVELIVPTDWCARLKSSRGRGRGPGGGLVLVLVTRKALKHLPCSETPRLI